MNPHYTGNPLEPLQWWKITDCLGAHHIIWGKPVPSGWEGARERGGLVVLYLLGMHTGEKHVRPESHDRSISSQ